MVGTKAWKKEAKSAENSGFQTSQIEVWVETLQEKIDETVDTNNALPSMLQLTESFWPNPGQAFSLSSIPEILDDNDFWWDDNYRPLDDNGR